MDFSDQLPCGGYANEDVAIEKDIANIVQGKEIVEKECSETCEESCTIKECEKPSLKGLKVCKKCSQGRAILLHKGEGICQQCLFKNLQYKIRLILQNSFKVDKKSNLLVCFSGGLNSICLTSLIVNIKKRYQKNKLFDRLGCVHIQQQDKIPEEYRQRFKEETGVELAVIKIQEALEKEGQSLQSVRHILNCFNKSANSVDLVSIFRDRLILNFAKQNDYHFVLKALNGQSLATESFKYFAKGLGGNIPNLCNNSQQSGPFYYPLRMHLQKQLQYYYYTKKLSVLALKSQEDNIENIATSGFDDHIKHFIDTLQQMYSHTAPAIVRTAQKIETNLPSHVKCKWCGLPGAQETSLCRRCNRVWQSRKKHIDITQFPQWLQAL